MAKIIDPDLLAQGVEVVFNTAAKTIQLLTAGDLSSDGVSMQALYSFCKEEWKNDSALIKFPFPLVAITEQKFDIVNGWDFADPTTRELIRDAGWALKDGSNVSLEEYMGVVTLGTVGGSDQIYYQQSEGGTSADMVLTGPANQAVKIYGDATHGNFDYRSFFKIFVREQGKLYGQSQLADIGQTTVTYQVYAFPLSNSTDLKITATDGDVETLSPYTGMSITYLDGTGFTTWLTGTGYVIGNVVMDPADNRWYIATANHTSGGTRAATAGSWAAYTGERQIGTSYYAFNVVIDGNDGETEKIYEFAQYNLRQETDIDDGAGTVVGKTANPLLSFVGETLVTNDGVYIDSFNSGDTNSIEFRDYSGTTRTYPFVAAGTIQFNENLVNDGNAIYRMYFTTNPGGNFGTATAILVNKNDDTPISGTISGSSVSFDFDYDGNVQGGRTAGTDAAVTVVAIGLSTGQYVSTTSTITRSNANAVSLVAALERNYSNPA